MTKPDKIKVNETIIEEKNGVVKIRDKYTYNVIQQFKGFKRGR